MNGADYVYAAARLKSLENKMLRREDYIRIAESGSYDEACSLLFDMGYFPPSDRSRDISSALEQKEKSVYDDVLELELPDCEMFLLENDFYNLKTCLKCIYDRESPVDLMNYPSHGWSREIFQCFRDNDFSMVPEPYKSITEHAYKIMSETGSGEDTERYIDKMFYKTGKSFGGFFAEWFELLSKLRGIDADAERKKLEFLKSRKDNVFGIEPVFAYFYAKLTEVKNVRIILYGKRSGAPQDVIKERLCDAYV